MLMKTLKWKHYKKLIIQKHLQYLLFLNQLSEVYLYLQVIPCVLYMMLSGNLERFKLGLQNVLKKNWKPYFSVKMLQINNFLSIKQWFSSFEDKPTECNTIFLQAKFCVSNGSYSKASMYFHSLIKYKIDQIFIMFCQWHVFFFFFQAIIQMGKWASHDIYNSRKPSAHEPRWQLSGHIQRNCHWDRWEC